MAKKNFWSVTSRFWTKVLRQDILDLSLMKIMNTGIPLIMKINPTPTTYKCLNILMFSGPTDNNFQKYWTEISLDWFAKAKALKNNLK